MSWPTATIGEVCEVVSGATPKTGNPDFWNGEVAWVTPKDLSELDQKYLSDTPRKITEAGLEGCSAKMLPSQSVLFSSRAPIGLVAINTIPVCTNQGFKSLVPRNGIASADFLYWWLKIHQRDIQQKGRGATFKEVSKEIVEDLRIPLPPLPEQKRLAAILDAADALRAKRREALAQLDSLLQATFLDMFGDPVTNPKGWEQLAVADLCESSDDVRCGPFGTQLHQHEFTDSGVPLWGIKHVNAGFAFPTDEFVSDEKAASLANYSIIPGDLVMTRKGTIGNCHIYPSSLSPGIMHSDLLRLRLSPTRAESQFICSQFVYSRHIQRQLELMSPGAVMPGINVTKLKKLAVEAPPLKFQHRFAAIAESVEQQKDRQRAHLTELDTLFASLQSRAFRGDL